MSRAPRCDKCRLTGSHLCLPRANRVVQVFERYLVHTKTRQWARTPFLLDDWQRDGIIVPLFGRVEWSDEWSAWVRQYRTMWFEISRKQGKSSLLAGVALVLMVADDEEGSEVYSCALDVDQARRVYDVAERMVELSPVLSKRITSYKQSKRLLDSRTGSFYQVIPADAAGNLGQNPHGILFDEVQEQPDGDLWDALRTGFGSRTQPLLVGAGTAGDLQASWAYAEHKYSERVASNPQLDPRRLVYMRNTPMDADVFDESLWPHANPALTGRRPFLSIQTIRDEALEARNDPRKEHAFRRFRMNQWQQAGSRWIADLSWDACAGTAVTSPAEADARVERQRCFGGLDLSATTDLTALCWLFPELNHTAIWRFWLPEDSVEALDRQMDGAISRWVDAGWISATPGAVIEYERVFEQIDQDRKRFRVVDLNYDRWAAAPIIQQLEARGLTSVQVQQGYALNAPLRELEKLLRARTFIHAGNPVARWNALSAEVKQDRLERLELVKPRRGATSARIDGIAALVFALDGVMRRGSAPARSKELHAW